MFSLKKIISISLLFFLFFTSAAQSRWSGKIVLSMIDSINRDYKRVKLFANSFAINPKIRKLSPKIDSVLHEVDSIKNNLPKCAALSMQLNPPTGSDDYHQSIKNYEDILKPFTANVGRLRIIDLNNSSAVNNFSTSTDTLIQTLSFIQNDVYLKFLANQNNQQSITVNVQVLDSSGTKIAGYNVFVKPYISSDPSMIVTFNPTNMATKDISAGWKLFWIEKNNQKIQSRDWHVKTNDPSSQNVIFILNH